MEYQRAKDLLIHEGTSENGIHVCVRSRTDPGHERMMRIVDAIETLIEMEDLTAPLDRKLAYSLFVIALETNAQSYSWQETKLWRDGGFNDDLIAIQDRITQYLEGTMVFD